MNDYWNDPPESPEPPACPNDKPDCNGFGEYLYDGSTGQVFSCDTCGYQWVKPFETEPQLEPNIDVDDIIPKQDKCPHGNDPSNCDACDRIGDFQYDCEKERRHFGI